MTTGSRSRRSSTSVLSTLTHKDASSSSSEEESYDDDDDNDDDDYVVVIDSNSDDDVDVKKSRVGRTKNVGVSSSSVASTAKTTHTTSTGMAKAQVPSDAKLKAQIEEMMKGVADIDTMSTKQFILAMSTKYNNGVDLRSKKEFIKATIVNLLTEKTSKTTTKPQSSAAKSSISNKNKVKKMTTSSTWDEDNDVDDDDDDDNRQSSLNNYAVSGAMSVKSSSNFVEINKDEGFDVVIPYALLNKHTGTGKNECTMLVQVNNDVNNQHHLDFHGQSGAIGRFETSATTNDNVNDTNNDDGGIILDLQGYQYNGTIHSGPTAMIMALGRDGKFKVEAITDEYVTLDTTSRTDVMAKLNAVVLHQGDDMLSYYDGDDNVNVVRRKQSGGSGRGNGDNKKNGKKKKKEEKHDGDTDDDDDYAADANGNVKHDTKNNKRKSITKSGDGGGLAKKKKKTLVSVAKKKD